MIILRKFTEEDAPVIQRELYPDMSAEEIICMIKDWQRNEYNGKYFEMFAVDADGGAAGFISLYEHSRSVASIGIEIFKKNRQKGYATASIELLMEYAKDRGYKILQEQILTTNTASIRLAEKLGAETDAYVYKNRKGNDVVLYLKLL